MQLMRAAHHVVRAFLLIGLGGLVASCGGGGGGGDAGGASSAPTSSVSVALASVPTIQSTLFEGRQGSSVSLQIEVSGDIDSLDGKTVYVIVEDPSSLFENPPRVFLNDTPPGAYVTLVGRKLDVAGHYKGNLKIHACLDNACSVELGNSPLAVPYDVTVLPGMTLDQQVFNVTVPFGQIPPVQTVAVTLPPSVTSWGVNNSMPYIRDPSMAASSTTDSSSATGVVSLRLEPALPGTYTRTAVVYTNVINAVMALHFEKTVTVTYTVTPDASVDWVFAPAAGNFTRIQGDPLFAAIYRKLVTNTGVTATWRGVEYLSNPPAADGHPQVNHWWSEYPSLGTSTCYNTGSSSNCLPVGTYTARVRYTLTKGGVDQDIYWPITLQIVSP
jgi:hypothetical protein